MPSFPWEMGKENKRVNCKGFVLMENGPVGDITIGYDPPRRARVIPMVIHHHETHEDVEDDGSG